jgi:hypothetical protein
MVRIRLRGLNRELEVLSRIFSIAIPFAKLIRDSWFATVPIMFEAMSERSPEQIHEQIRELLDCLYRVDSGRILATLIRLLGDFDLAERRCTKPLRLR